MSDDDDIPLLTEVVRRERSSKRGDRRAADRLTEAQIRQISAASASLIVRIVKQAMTDVERQLVLKISRELQEQLPRLVVEALREQPGPANDPDDGNS